MSKRPETTNPLDKLFPLPDGEDELLLGYPDLTGEVVTRELEDYPRDDLLIIQKYAELGRVGYISHIDFLLGLMQGLHERDPHRNSEGAVLLAQDQIDGSREHFRLLGAKGFIPYLVGYREDEEATDSYGTGWYLYPTNTDQEIWLAEFPETLDVTQEFLHDPTKHEEYSGYMLNTIDRFIELHRSPSIIVFSGAEYAEHLRSGQAPGVI